MVHNIDYEPSLGCTLAGLCDCRVSCSIDLNLHNWNHKLWILTLVTIYPSWTYLLFQNRPMSFLVMAHSENILMKATLFNFGARKFLTITSVVVESCFNPRSEPSLEAVFVLCVARLLFMMITTDSKVGWNGPQRMLLVPLVTFHPAPMLQGIFLLKCQILIIRLSHCSRNVSNIFASLWVETISQRGLPLVTWSTIWSQIFLECGYLFPPLIAAGFHRPRIPICAVPLLSKCAHWLSWVVVFQF